ncbi:MAG: aldehyde dehydrogenase family protein [Thermoplasmata archaeon]
MAGKMLSVKNKFNNEIIREIEETKLNDTKKILDNALIAFKKNSKLPVFKRYEFLLNASEQINKKQDELARIITLESGKPIKYARKETKRASFTIKSSGEEAKNIHGETVPLDVEPRGQDRFAYYIRVPIGPIFSITPFNDPLNLVAHKIGPALAAGNSIINKPAILTPLSSLKLEEIIEESGFPEYSFQNIIASGGSEVTQFFLNSDLIKKITFTGGTEAADRLVKSVGPKKYSMELGNNSPVIICKNSDWKNSISSIVEAAFEVQGQNCIHAQRIIVQKNEYSEFVEEFIKSARKLRVGDPLDESVDLGPMISEEEAKRVEEWVNSAVDEGAEILMGGKREGSIYFPTVLEKVSNKSTVWKNEVFGPVTIIKAFDDIDEALNLANDTLYGLQAGIFTSDIKIVMKAIDTLDYGSILVNDTSDFRIDTMPFGGMKKSGIGREGIRFSIEEMTEIKLVILKK